MILLLLQQLIYLGCQETKGRNVKGSAQFSVLFPDGALQSQIPPITKLFNPFLNSTQLLAVISCPVVPTP